MVLDRLVRQRYGPAVTLDPRELDSLQRPELIERARQAGAERPEVLTRVELKDEILRLTELDEAKRREVRGWLGAARDLVAGVVEQGLNMPDAAAFIRRRVPMTSVAHAPPVPTVTLAEIYASQGHLRRALKMLDDAGFNNIRVEKLEHDIINNYYIMSK